MNDGVHVVVNVCFSLNLGELSLFKLSFLSCCTFVCLPAAVDGFCSEYQLKRPFSPLIFLKNTRAS